MILTLLIYAPPSSTARRAALLLSDRPVATSSSMGSAARRRSLPPWSLHRRGERALVECAQFGLAEQRLAGEFDGCGLLGAVDERGHLRGKSLLRQTQVRSLGSRAFEFIDLIAVQKREPAQVADDIGVGGIDEVLVPDIRAGEFGIEP